LTGRTSRTLETRFQSGIPGCFRKRTGDRYCNSVLRASVGHWYPSLGVPRQFLVNIIYPFPFLFCSRRLAACRQGAAVSNRLTIGKSTEKLFPVTNRLNGRPPCKRGCILQGNHPPPTHRFLVTCQPAWFVVEAAPRLLNCESTARLARQENEHLF